MTSKNCTGYNETDAVTGAKIFISSETHSCTIENLGSPKSVDYNTSKPRTFKSIPNAELEDVLG